jgi:hypothetical protein
MLMVNLVAMRWLRDAVRRTLRNGGLLGGKSQRTRAFDQTRAADVGQTAHSTPPVCPGSKALLTTHGYYPPHPAYQFVV